MWDAFILHPITAATSNANRLDLAKWLVSTENPLTARVIVNRVWQQYFGRGLVETENDFGLQGATPTHPELLDWLAVEFMEQGWSLKQLHRLIATSETYRQSSHDRPDLKEKDPKTTCSRGSAAFVWKRKWFATLDWPQADCCLRKWVDHLSIHRFPTGHEPRSSEA